MDDFLILSKTRWQLRKAIKKVHEIVNSLGVKLHEKKRYIGKINKQGIDFWGYRINNGKVSPSAESLHRVAANIRRLYENGADRNRLRLYIERWSRYFRSALPGPVSLHQDTFIIDNLLC